MKIYVLASFRMTPDEKKVRELTTMLNLSLRLCAEDCYFLNVTSSDADFLNDARRLAGGKPPTIPFNGCMISKKKKSGRS